MIRTNASKSSNHEESRVPSHGITISPSLPNARQPSTGRATYPGTSSILKRLGVRCPSATTWLKICYSSERHGQKKCGACLRTRALCVTATHLLHSRRSSSSSHHHHCSLQLLADSDSRLLGSGSSRRYFLNQRFSVLCFDICTPSVFSSSPLCGASFKTK